MKNILTLIKKELTRVIKDKRLVVTIFILPGLMIFLMYSFMGDAITKMNNDTSKHQAVIYTYEMPEDYKLLLDREVKNSDNEVLFAKPLITEMTDLSNLSTLQDGLKDKSVDLILIFEDDFLTKLQSNAKPTIEFYYNSTNNNSVLANETAQGYFNVYNSYSIVPTSIYDDKTLSSDIMTNLMPFLIITLLFSGITSIAPESIAGEKERGTIATLLITPIKRSEIAIGKVTSLSILSLISALSSFIGVLLSIDKIAGGSGNLATLYGVGDYLLIMVLLFSTVLFLVGIVSIISAYAKTVKEASMYIMPIMIISMLISLSSMFSKEAVSQSYLYLIPLYNTVQALTQIFALKINTMNLAITVLINVGYTGILIFILTKMFNNEKVMFNK